LGEGGAGPEEREGRECGTWCRNEQDRGGREAEDRGEGVDTEGASKLFSLSAPSISACVGYMMRHK